MIGELLAQTRSLSSEYVHLMPFFVCWFFPTYLDYNIQKEAVRLRPPSCLAMFFFFFFFPADAEKGCHFLHVLSCVRQSYNPNLAEVVMQRVLELLESNSDIVSTMEGYYMAF